MSTTNTHIVQAALDARTPKDADAVQALIEGAIGVRYQRPVGDRWNNQGLLTASGSSYDHKILETVTNGHDAVLELLAVRKWGSIGAVPYSDPHAAAEDLFAGMDTKTKAALSEVRLYPADTTGSKKRITAIARDYGTGIGPPAVPRTIFQLGSSHKDGVDWQQGNFGVGGATVFINAESAVLVTRRQPELLQPGEEDRITIAVVQWERRHTTVNAFYLVTSPWAEPGEVAEPFSVPAADYPEFAAGTHLALISYGTEGLATQSSDERSFATVFNTRLYRPVVPISYQNNYVRDRIEVLDGLERRLDDNPGEAGTEGRETLPFNANGTTYHLPIRFRLFSKPGEAGERRKFVARGHALVITSNGQVHSHWTGPEFKLRTKLPKLYDRILVVVESDALPLELRTSLFTADRAQMVRTDPAIRLENEVAEFLNNWSQLGDANKALIREAISGDSSGRPTIDIARQIARALKVKGFSSGRSAGGTGGGGKGDPPPPTDPEDLYVDPTHFEGPETVTAQLGRSKSVFFKLNAVDDFLGTGKRGELVVMCEHPDIGTDEITVGELRAGRIRVSIAVPDAAAEGIHELRATIPPWTKSSGGLGPQFEWTAKLETVTEVKPKAATGGNKKGSKGAKEGDLVALIWKKDADEDGWTPNTVGTVEMVAAVDLATRDEYKDLAPLGNTEVPTVVLNQTYSPLKAYIHARAAELTEEGKEKARDRYAVGAGVGLLTLDAQIRKDEKAGKLTDETLLGEAQRATAKSVLAVLPHYDQLAKEAEIE